MVSDKIRVYVALYFRNFITSDPALVKQYGTGAYHWGIYLETKDEHTAYVFDVKDDDPYINQGISGGWTYHPIYNVRFSRSMLAKVMIGKPPTNIDPHAVGNMLGKIPLLLRNTNPVQNCVTCFINHHTLIHKSPNPQNRNQIHHPNPSFQNFSNSSFSSYHASQQPI